VTSTCECGKPTRNDAYVCDTCADTATQVLNEMPWLSDELDISVARLRAAGSGEGSASRETALPFADAIAERRDALRNALVTAVRHCVEDGVRHQSSSDDMPKDTLAAMARWLLWRVDGLTLNDMGGEMLDGIVSAARSCRRVIDLPPERWYAGPCPDCKRDMYHRPQASDVKCRGCDKVWLVAEVVAWMHSRITEHMTDRLVTASEGATLLGRLGLETAQATIDKWHDRKLVTEAGRTPPNPDTGKTRRLYRWDDLLTVAQRHAAQRAS
jgi:ribosomal protein L37AE/L43A